MVKGWRASGTAIPALLSALIFFGCGAVATRTKFYKPISADLVAGNYTKAARSFEKAKFDHKDRFLYYIDSGALYHYASDFDTSNVRLTQAENAAEALYTKSVSRAAASMLLNDNVLEYAGEDYEILYANILKSLNYLETGNLEDAFVEIRRADLKLQLLEQKYREAADILNRGEKDDTSKAKINYVPGDVRFNNDAFARYLSMHMYAAEGKWDDARIDYDFLVDAFRSQPNIYNFEMPNVTYAADSGAILSVVGLVGLCPVKEALNLRIRTDKDLGLVQVLYTDSGNDDVEYGHLPWPVSADYYFKFAIPKMAVRPSNVSSVKIWADDMYLGEVGLIEDVGNIAQETFNAKKNLIYLRSVARAIAKGLATHKLKKKADTGGLGGWLKKAAIDVGSDISENADLRCARFLPGRIFAGDFTIPPGTYNLTVKFLDLEGRVIETQRISDCIVNDGNFNLIRVMSAE
jgi:hypothetical protein